MSEDKDVLAEWMRLGREILSRYYPEAKYGLLLIHTEPDIPDVQLPVTQSPRSASSGPSLVNA